METFIQFLQRYYEGGEGFLQCIVMDNETWVHHYGPASKCQSITQDQENQNCAFCQQSDTEAVLEL
jgi:hypothetical protein